MLLALVAAVVEDAAIPTLGDEWVVTAEIALLNKFAIALAADSATTVGGFKIDDQLARVFSVLSSHEDGHQFK
jgi:short subunit fatty acids transporter